MIKKCKSYKEEWNNLYNNVKYYSWNSLSLNFEHGGILSADARRNCRGS